MARGSSELEGGKDDEEAPKSHPRVERQQEEEEGDSVETVPPGRGDAAEGFVLLHSLKWTGGDVRQCLVVKNNITGLKLFREGGCWSCCRSVSV